jgi:hypothetical protein
MISNGPRQYDIGDQVAETAFYRLYLCREEGSDRGLLLQVATGVEHNGKLDRSAYLLGVLLQHAEDLEKEYAGVKTDPKDMLNYQFAFPELADSFIASEQGGRRINILGFRNVEDARQMVPLYNIVHRDRRRVDLRTSVWILGKLLKILVFVHDAGITVDDLTLGNVLIEPDKHYVLVFNWADAEKHPDGVSGASAREEIQRAARCVIEVLGGDADLTIPDDGTEQYARYVAHLVALARDGERSADSAHRAFYALVDRLSWPRGKYPFTSLPLVD